MLTEKIVGEPRGPDIPVGRTESTTLGRLVYAVRVLRLDLLGFRGRAGAHRLRRALRPLAVHATVPGVTHRAVATGGTLTGDAATHTLGRGRSRGRGRNRLEARDDRPQGFQLSENLVHLGLGGLGEAGGDLGVRSGQTPIHQNASLPRLNHVHLG